MNVANLQIQGLCMALEAFQRLLVSKGILSVDEAANALKIAEQELIGSVRAVEDLAPADRDALVFPLRLLQVALQSSQPVGFTDLAVEVGTTKPRYNDQM